MEMDEHRCVNCRVNYAQWPHSNCCEYCSDQVPNAICSMCETGTASTTCLCTYPLPAFCSTCSTKHFTSKAHLAQSLKTMNLLKTREQYDSHKSRIECIDVVKTKLNIWCKTQVENAKTELELTVKMLHSLLENQFEKMKGELEATIDKIDRVCKCLEDMKEDYNLQTGTFIDDIVGRSAGESDLRKLESLFRYIANSVDSNFCILGGLFSVVDEIPDIASMQSYAAEQSFQPLQSSYYASLPETYETQTTNLQYQEDWDYSQVAPESTKTCSVCQNCFYYVNESQVGADGRWYCSTSCKDRCGPSCLKCGQVTTDHSWWPKAQERYPESSQFQRYCSLFCFASSLPQDQKRKCVWCQVTIDSANLPEIDAVQLDCLHSFHNIDCVVSYMSAVTNKVSEKLDYVCPTCDRKMPIEVVKLALKAHGRKETLWCQKCDRKQAELGFNCEHVLCKSCAERKVFWRFGKEKYLCTICGKTRT